MVELFATFFLVCLVLSTALQVWLALRQSSHVCAHRDTVPAEFAERISLTDHRKAADYTVARVRLGIAELSADTALLLLFTFGGLLAAFNGLWREVFPDADIAHGLALIASIGLTGFLVGLPFALYRTFVLEARFGFNKTTPGLFVSDLARSLALAIIIGGPLLAAVLWLMGAMGSLWWLWVWAVWLGFNLLALLLYPNFIAPLFNKFTPLPEGETKQRIEALLSRCGLSSTGASGGAGFGGGIFVMDGSKRSARGNAYFTGFGRAKRIVFFDTLLDRLSPDEIEAVLAHELGHDRLKHLWKRILAMSAMALAFLWLLGQLIDQPWFYEALKVGDGGTAMGLALFALILPVFSFPLAPVLSWLSRRHEFEADAYAARQASGSALISALVKLYRDNAATLTPDPLYSLFHDSHPSAAARIAHLKTC